MKAVSFHRFHLRVGGWPPMQNRAQISMTKCLFSKCKEISDPGNK